MPPLPSLPGSPSGKAGNSVVMSIVGLEDLIKALRDISHEVAYKSLQGVMRQAIKPTQRALQANVASLGTVTGNLARAVTTRVPPVYRTGVQVGIVGFQRTGKGGKRKPGQKGGPRIGGSHAFHSHLIEFGTASKKPLTMYGRQLQRSAAGRRDRKRLEKAGLGYILKRDYGVLTAGKDNPYNRFFVTISPRGLKEIKGTPAFRPMSRAFQTTRAEAQQKLQVGLQKALQAAVKKYGKGGA